jgi:hypothetical protein
LLKWARVRGASTARRQARARNGSATHGGATRNLDPGCVPGSARSLLGRSSCGSSRDGRENKRAGCRAVQRDHESFAGGGGAERIGGARGDRTSVRLRGMSKRSLHPRCDVSSLGGASKTWTCNAGRVGASVMFLWITALELPWHLQRNPSDRRPSSAPLGLTDSERTTSNQK